MKKMMIAAIAAATAFTAAPASAATLVTLSLQNGALVGVFGNSFLRGSGTDDYTFDLSSAGNLFASANSLDVIFIPDALDFTSVTLNGKDFDIISTGTLERRTITQAVNAGTQLLSVGYANGQGLSSYAGRLEFRPTAAVPEPATWAMMLVGFGMVAGAARYRRRSTTATYA